MGEHTLTLPDREGKPRQRGLTMVIDNGVPTRHFEDALSSFGELIDLVKFGWGTCLATPDIATKTALAAEHGVDFSFGGTLFEKFVHQNRLDAWYKLCCDSKVSAVEISNGTIPLSNADKAAHVRRLAGDFTVLSEVGFKDPECSDSLEPRRWADYIRQDLDAGASRVILESRESGNSGMCHTNGTVRSGLLESLTDSGIDLNQLIFEAPTKDLQTFMIRRVGSYVNLGNVHLDDVIGLETLRLGLRADTLIAFEEDNRA